MSLSLITLFTLSACTIEEETFPEIETPKSVVTIEKETQEPESVLSEELDETAASKYSPSNPYAPNSEDPIIGFISDLKFTSTAETLYLNATPEYASARVLNTVCSSAKSSNEANILGCFSTSPKKIYLYNITDPRMEAAEPVIAAHELLHAVWFDMDDKERALITVLLKNYFNALPAGHYLRDRLDAYADTPDSIPTELHSILGTESGNLPPELEAHYKKYFKSRNPVTELAGASFGYIHRLEIKNDETTLLINSSRAPLDSERLELDRLSFNLDQDITYFNTTFANGYPESAKEIYLSEKKALDDRKEKISQASKAFQTKIEEFNVLISEHNESIALYNALNNAIKTG